MPKKKTLKIDLSIGDSAKVLRDTFEPNSIDALITDPPYGLGQEPDPVELLRGWIQQGDHAGKGGGFMNANWDSIVPGPGIWQEVLRVLKPGARGGAFFGTRTLHLGVASLRIAGFSIEKIHAWCYGSGFPKSLNVHKSLVKKVSKRYGDSRCKCMDPDYENLFDPTAVRDLTQKKPRKLILDDYDENKLTCRVCSWCALPDQNYMNSLQGLGTALKPAFEPIVIVRKPEVPIQLDLPELLTKYGCSEDQIEYIMTPHIPD